MFYFISSSDKVHSTQSNLLVLNSSTSFFSFCFPLFVAYGCSYAAAIESEMSVKHETSRLNHY